MILKKLLNQLEVYNKGKKGTTRNKIVKKYNKSV